MAIKEIRKNKLVWINIDRVDQEAISYLKEHYNFHQLDFDDIQGESQTPKIDVYKNYLFLVLQFPQWQPEVRQVRTYELDIFMGADYLITIQHTKSKEIKNFFYRCMNNRKINQEWMSQTSGFLLYKLLEALLQQSRPILNNIGRQITKIENEIFTGEQDLKEIRELAIHRTNILSFRRIIEPQRYLMSNLSNTRQPYLEESLSLYFDNLRDYLDQLWSFVEAYKETVHGLYITVESIINQRTSKVLTILTVISVALIPHTLLFNMYGMNLEGLPFAEHESTIWFMITALSITVAVTLVMLLRRMKRKGWF